MFRGVKFIDLLNKPGLFIASLLSMLKESLVGKLKGRVFNFLSSGPLCSLFFDHEGVELLVKGQVVEEFIY